MSLSSKKPRNCGEIKVNKHIKLLQRNSESYLSAVRISFFAFFGAYSQGISILTPMTNFPSGASLGLPVTLTSIISICWLFIKLNNFLENVYGTWPTISSFPIFLQSRYRYACCLAQSCKNRSSLTFTANL